MKRSIIKLTSPIDGDAPPTEFRIFTAGVVDTVKGQFIFDAKAAKSVMAEYEAHGIDLPIDYSHSMLEAAVDPSLAHKAAGWFALEVRHGELWAVNVRWTPPASEALLAREWRFISPAFSHDAEGRVTALVNVAITNLPATRRLEPLMAAGRKASMAASKVAGAASPEAETQLVEIAAVLGLEEPLEASTIVDAVSALAAPEEEDPEAPPPDELAVTAAKLRRLTGHATTADALSEVNVWRSSHMKLETETLRLSKEVALLESAERRRLCASLIREAGRAPAAVWADTMKKNLQPKGYLAEMPLASLRQYVKDAISTVPRNARFLTEAPPRPPMRDEDRDTIPTEHGPVTLSQVELDRCAAAGVSVEVYAKNKAIHLAARGGRG